MILQIIFKWSWDNDRGKMKRILDWLLMELNERWRLFQQSGNAYNARDRWKRLQRRTTASPVYVAVFCFAFLAGQSVRCSGCWCDRYLISWTDRHHQSPVGRVFIYRRGPACVNDANGFDQGPLAAADGSDWRPLIMETPAMQQVCSLQLSSF